MEKQVGDNVLRRRLANNEEMDREEATGDHFHRMLEDIGKVSQAASPYTLEEGELVKRVQSLQAEFGTLRDKLEQLWKVSPVKVALPCKFTFSATAKRESTTLSENNTRATGGSYSTVIIEPRLPTNSVSKISFRIHKCGWLLLGVCYRALVEKRNFAYSRKVTELFS